MYAIKAIYAILYSPQMNDLESWELVNMTAKTPLMSSLDSSVACTLCNIIYSKESTTRPEVVISTDAEKASDRVKWDYLFAVGFGESLISWLCILYTLPWASITTNNIQSGYFFSKQRLSTGLPSVPSFVHTCNRALSIWGPLPPSMALPGHKKSWNYHYTLTICYYTSQIQLEPVHSAQHSSIDLADSQGIKLMLGRPNAIL